MPAFAARHREKEGGVWGVWEGGGCGGWTLLEAQKPQI